MVTVARAPESKLGRTVAIKVLPPAVAADAEYLARFRREAQVLASLNHPNIAAIYGVEENAIVMELVEGAESWEELLSTLGANGWELVQVVPGPEVTYWFKRHA